MAAGALVITDYRLLEVQGPERGDVWPIREKPLVIGRNPACDIVVTDPYVSRRQCEIWRSERGVELRNLSRTNPTVVNNGLMLEPIIDLQVGDRLSIGPCRFLVTTEGSLPHDPAESRSSASRPENKPKDGTTLFIRQLP